MIRDWLIHSNRSNHRYKYNIIDVSETDIRAETAFPLWLATELLLAYKNPNHLKRRYSKRGKAELRDYLINEVFPPLTTVIDKNVRRGDWGEIVTSLILRDIGQLETALIKLRYKLNRKKSSFGIDVFGVQLDKAGKVCGLCVCETKTKITYDKKIGIKAHDSLFSNDTSAIITISDFMSTLYYNEGKLELSDQFDEIVLQKANFPTNHHVFLVHEKNKWNEDILVELDNLQGLKQGFNVNVLLIDDLDHLANHSFSLIPDVGEDIVYGTP
ncbi:Hachiman antiphage defense system protein HamA [Metabacillus fastidiosus]|uniref:Hachiman antiphage defense system protein HamA n=1 Tax=Metabacillus fastidiosus TaxID=1458 RepID=UPI003D27ABC2